MFCAGVDAAENNREASVVNEKGGALSESISFSNSRSGCDKLLKLTERFSADKENAAAGMEAAGRYRLSVYSYLLELGFDLKAVNPIQSESFRKTYVRRTKNDSKDSFIIAQIMRFGQFSESGFPDEKTQALRQLCRYRFVLVDECSDWKRKAIALSDQVFPEYAPLFSDTFGASGKEVPLACPAPEDMLSITLAELPQKSGRGRFSSDKAARLRQAAQNTFGVKFAKDAFAFQIRRMTAQIKFIEDRLSGLEAEISRLLNNAAPIVTAVAGIGEILGAVVVSETGGISRFDSAPKPAAFAGLDVSVKQSGEFPGTRNKISKRGSPHLRRAVWTAASRAAFAGPALSEYYKSLRARGKRHLTSVGAAARKLCSVVFAVLRDNKPYTPVLPKTRPGSE